MIDFVLDRSFRLLKYQNEIPHFLHFFPIEND